MEHSFTNRAKHWRGNTVAMTVRLPQPLAEFIDSRVDGTGPIRNRSEYLQHWASIGQLVEEDDDLAEALDWALDRSVQEPEQTFSEQVTPPGQIISVPSVFGFVDDTVAEVVPPEPVPTDELGQIRESQLEALRNRVH